VSQARPTLDERSRGSAPVEEADPSKHLPDASTGEDVGPSTTARTTVIKPAARLPRLDVPELWHFRELLGTLVWRDVVVRYKQTFLGVAWALLVPVFTSAVYVVVFGKFADFPSGDVAYPSLVVAGVLPMQYFASSLTGSSMSLAMNLQLVTKVYFPRVLLPLAAVLVPLVDFIVGLPVLMALMWFYGTWPGGAEVAFAPLFIGLAVVTALGSGLMLSTLNVRYRDVRYMIPVFLQVLPLLSGVMYSVDQLETKWQWVLAINPMTTVISGWRWAVLDAAQPDLGQSALGFAVAAVVFLGGMVIFRSSEPRFADTI
jgi:lipopolysaccharide transport system permease protein